MSRSPARIHRVTGKALSRHAYARRLEAALEGHPEAVIQSATRLLDTGLARTTVAGYVSKTEDVARVARGIGLLAGRLSEAQCAHLVGSLVEKGWTRDKIDGALSTIARLHGLAGLPDPTKAAATTRWLPPMKKTEERRSPRPLRLATGTVSVADIVARPRKTRQDLVRAALVALAHSTGFHKDALVRVAPASFHRLPEGVAIEMELRREFGTKRFTAAVNETAFALVCALAADVGLAAPLTPAGDADERPIFRALNTDFSWKETHLAASYVEKHLKAAVRATAQWKLGTGALNDSDLQAAERQAELTSARSPRRGLIKDLYDADVELLQIAAYVDGDISEVCACLGVPRPVRGKGTW